MDNVKIDKKKAEEIITNISKKLLTLLAESVDSNPELSDEMIFIALAEFNAGAFSIFDTKEQSLDLFRDMSELTKEIINSFYSSFQKESKTACTCDSNCEHDNECDCGCNTKDNGSETQN